MQNMTFFFKTLHQGMCQDSPKRIEYPTMAVFYTEVAIVLTFPKF